MTCLFTSISARAAATNGGHAEGQRPADEEVPHCGKSQLQRLMSAPVFRLKGGGWYETDFKGDQDNKRNLADKPEAESTKDESAKADAKVDAKTEAKSVIPRLTRASQRRQIVDSGSGEGVKSKEKPTEKSAEKTAGTNHETSRKARRAKRTTRPLKKGPVKAKRRR